VSSRGELAAQLALIRRNGFAMEEAGEDGSCSIAAAVMDSRARPTGAIGVIFPATGTPHRGVAALTRMVTATAAEITSNWGGRRPPPAPVVLPGPPAVLDLSDHEPSWLPEGDVPC
jgi:DNA-binding IclR family transcriptional regulator